MCAQGKIENEIETLRQQLYLLYEQKGSFADVEVAKLSSQLDQLIVLYEHIKLANRKG